MPKESATISKLYCPEVSLEGTFTVRVTNLDVGFGGWDANSKLDSSNSLTHDSGIPLDANETESTPLPLLVTKNVHVAVSPGLTSVVEDCKSNVMLYSCATFTVYVNEETWLCSL